MKVRALACIALWVFAFVATATCANATECASAIGSCEYYLCRESLQPCGAEGYFVRFGYTYCEKFERDVEPRMTPEGAAWMDRVASCLQAAVDELPWQTSCGETESLAIGSHSNCYVSTGFCALPLSDQYRILRTVYRETLDIRIDRQILDIMDKCGG